MLVTNSLLESKCRMKDLWEVVFELLLTLWFKELSLGVPIQPWPVLACGASRAGRGGGVNGPSYSALAPWEHSIPWAMVAPMYSAFAVSQAGTVLVAYMHWTSSILPATLSLEKCSNSPKVAFLWSCRPRVYTSESLCSVSAFTFRLPYLDHYTLYRLSPFFQSSKGWA